MRLDYFGRAAFRVLGDGRTYCRLMVGKNLTDLYQRTVGIAKACPDIACQPLFWHQADGWDYFATEFFEGENLEHLVLSGRMTPDEAVGHAEKIVTALERTSQSSSTDAAAHELDQLFDRVRALPLFGGLDQPFLDNIIFPPVRAGALAETPKTRWTNGDLIARNILIDAQGNARLIDYEFAARTHFSATDAWRWQKLSTLPPEARILPSLGHELQAKPWLESLFILLQMALQYEINGAQIAVEDARPAITRLLTLSADPQAGLRTSAFLRMLAAGAVPSVEKAQAMCAQLYWSHNGSHRESQSVRLDYMAGSDVALSFLARNVQGRVIFRFDPAEMPGLIQISAVRLHNPRAKKVLLSFNQSTGWDGLHLASGLFRLIDSPFLNLLSLNADPGFHFPVIDVGESPYDLICDIWLRFSIELTALPGLLPPSPATATPV